MTVNYQNNPLHGLGLETLVTELVDHYGWEILAAAKNFNCFKMNPSIKGSVKFLKKTEWARVKLEEFYLYRFKSLPKPGRKDFGIPPRDRIIPDDQKPGDPAELTIEDLEEERKYKERKAREFNEKRGARRSNDKPNRSLNRKRIPEHSSRSKKEPSGEDPWAAARKKFDENSNKD